MKKLLPVVEQAILGMTERFTRKLMGVDQPEIKEAFRHERGNAKNRRKDNQR